MRDSTRMRERKPERQARTLERVRTAAQRTLPGIPLEKQESTVFARIDPAIDELDVMEVLLEIETEFAVDLPQEVIYQRVGQEHRRDLRSHLSLSLIAECVEEVLVNQER